MLHCCTRNLKDFELFWDVHCVMNESKIIPVIVTPIPRKLDAQL